jgi:hypothetical protein
VRCIDRRALYGAALLVSTWLAGCADRAPSAPAPPPLPSPGGTAAPPTGPAQAGPATQPPLPPTGSAPGGQVATPPVGGVPGRPRLDPPTATRSWDEFRLQAARRLVAASPGITYQGPPPEPLLAIPVLEVELNGDGSVRRVVVLRHPKQARETTQIAIDAVQRGAPYGSMSRLPQPWKWVEVFLFNDDRHFKPRELDK